MPHMSEPQDLVPQEPPVSGARPRQTIALVDDDRNILTTVSIALQAEGFATRVYADGETALKALLENPPDLAIFDIKMPRMDGLELLQRLRENSALPVIFLTSKDEEPDEALGLAHGRGRLYHQAVQPAPAGRPHPRDPAPQRAGAAPSRDEQRRRANCPNRSAAAG